jgi:hypothetical protein
MPPSSFQPLVMHCIASNTPKARLTLIAPPYRGRSGNGFAVSRLSLSIALAALIAVIGAKRARRSPEGR